MGTLTYEKVNYKYPSNWTVTSQNIGSSDFVVIKAPNEKFSVSLISGTGSGVADNYATKPVYSQPVNTLGGSYFLNYYATASDGKVDYVNLVTSADAGASNLTDKTVNVSGGKYLSIGASYSDGNPPAKPLATFLSDPNMATAKLIIQSMHY